MLSDLNKMSNKKSKAAVIYRKAPEQDMNASTRTY